MVVVWHSVRSRGAKIGWVMAEVANWVVVHHGLVRGGGSGWRWLGLCVNGGG